MELYKIFLVICFILLSGFFQGQMEKISFNFYQSIFVKHPTFFNPKISFFRKYKQLLEVIQFTDQDGKTYSIHTVDKSKERFPGSTTVFVWLTDGWHLFKMISGTCFVISITILGAEIFALNFAQSLILFAGIKFIETLTSSLSYKLNLKK